MNKKHLVSTILSFLILSLFLIPYFNVSAKTTSQYKGKIGNYPITIEVYKEEKDKIKGRYMYDKVGKWLKLEGKILKNNRVIIYEYDENNKNTGRFIGKIEKGNVLKIEKYMSNKTKKYLNVRLPKIVLGENFSQHAKDWKIKKFHIKEDYYFVMVGPDISPSKDYVYVIFSKKIKNDDKESEEYYVQVNEDLYGPFFRGGVWGHFFQMSENGSKFGWVVYVKDIDGDLSNYILIIDPYRKKYKIYGPYEGIGNFYFSKNGETYGWWYREGADLYIQINDKTYGPYDYWEEGKTFHISYDGKIYSWFFKKDEKFYFQLNDKTYGPFDDDPFYSYILTNDGWIGYFRFFKNKSCYEFIKGKIYGPFYDCGYIITSLDESIFGFNFWKNYFDAYVQVGEKIYGPYDDVTELRFSKDSKTWGFAFKKDKKIYTIVNGKLYGPYNDLLYTYNKNLKDEDLSLPDLIFFGKGEIWVLGINTSKGYYIITHNNKIYGPYNPEHIPYMPYIPYILTYSEKLNKFYIWEYDSIQNKYYIEIDNKRYGPYDSIPITYWKYLLNESIFIAEVKKEGKWYIQANDNVYGPIDVEDHYYIDIVDEKLEGNPKDVATSSGFAYFIKAKDKLLGPYNQIKGIAFSKNGNVILYSYKDQDKYFVKVNDSLYGPYDDLGSFIKISENGTLWGWVYKKDLRWFVLINNRIYGPYLFVSDFKLTNDGKKYGWIAEEMFKHGNKFMYFLHINDRTYGPYDKANFIFTENNETYIIYIDGSNLVVEKINL
jgi:hypothetical protein